MNDFDEEKACDTNSAVSHHIPSPNSDEIGVFRELVFISLCALSQLLTQAAVAQTINPIDAIGETFGVENDPGQLSWFPASFSLTVGTFILISGRLGDMYGYKKMYIVGFCWFGVFSLAAGFSAFEKKSVILFDIMRALQGVGPAIILPNTQALIGNYYPPSMKKDLVMCFFGAVAPTGFVLGALFSGIFAQLVWWPWGFWVLSMVCFLTAIIGLIFIPHHIGSTKHQGKFDYLGSITGVSGLILINFAWNQGPNVGWDKPYVYVLLIVGVLCLIAFFFIEKRVDDPLVPPVVLKGDTGFILACIGAGWSCFGSWLFYGFRWEQIVNKQTPIMSAVRYIPCIFSGYVAAFMTGYLLKVIPLSVVMFMAMIAFFIGTTLLATRPVDQIYWRQQFFAYLIQCFGMDMSFPAGCILISQAVPASQQGIAGSLVSTFVNYSLLVGIGISGTAETYITKGLPDTLSTKIHGMRTALYVSMGLAGFGIVMSMLYIVIQYFGKKSCRQNSTTNFSDKKSHNDRDELTN